MYLPQNRASYIQSSWFPSSSTLSLLYKRTKIKVNVLGKLNQYVLFDGSSQDHKHKRRTAKCMEFLVLSRALVKTETIKATRVIKKVKTSLPRT